MTEKEFDDQHVDEFSQIMKDKLDKARAKGRHGWQEASPEYLTKLLHDHVTKGDPVDVANLAMMVYFRTANGRSI